MLTIVAVYFELKLVRACRPLGWAIQKWALFGLVFSMWLSIQLGLFFHAASSAMMAAGMASTMAANMVYGWRAKMQVHSSAFHRRVTKVKVAKAEFKTTYRPVGRLAMAPVKILYKTTKIPVNKKYGRPIWS